jgi:hypothetical protein
MRLIRIAFKKRCPWCKHVNKFDLLEEEECQNCGASLGHVRDKLTNPFKDSPVPQGYDRRIRSSSYRFIRVGGAKDKIKRYHITWPLLIQAVHLDENNKLIDWNKIDSAVRSTSKEFGLDVSETGNLAVKMEIEKLLDEKEFLTNIYDSNVEKLDKMILKSTGARKENAKERRDEVYSWHIFLSGNGHNFQNSVEFKYIVATVLYGLEPNEIALERMFEKIVDNPPVNKRSLVSIYEDNLEKVKAGIDAEEVDLSDLKDYTGWVYIPGEETTGLVEYEEDIRRVLNSDLRSFKERVYILNRISQGTGWCTGEGMEDEYLAQGNFWKYLENGKAKLSIRDEWRIDESDDVEQVDYYIQEIQGRFNENNNAYPYIDKLIELDQKYPGLGIMDHPDEGYGLSGDEIQYVKEKRDRYFEIFEKEGKDRLVEEVLKASWDFDDLHSFALFTLDPYLINEIKDHPKVVQFLESQLLNIPITEGYGAWTRAEMLIPFVEKFPLVVQGKKYEIFAERMFVCSYLGKTYNNPLKEWEKRKKSFDPRVIHKIENNGFTFEGFDRKLESGEYSDKLDDKSKLLLTQNALDNVFYYIMTENDFDKAEDLKIRNHSSFKENTFKHPTIMEKVHRQLKFLVGSPNGTLNLIQKFIDFFNIDMYDPTLHRFFQNMALRLIIKNNLEGFKKVYVLYGKRLFESLQLSDQEISALSNGLVKNLVSEDKQKLWMFEKVLKNYLLGAKGTRDHIAILVKESLEHFGFQANSFVSHFLEEYNIPNLLAEGNQVDAPEYLGLDSKKKYNDALRAIDEEGSPNENRD